APGEPSVPLVCWADVGKVLTTARVTSTRKVTDLRSAYMLFSSYAKAALGIWTYGTYRSHESHKSHKSHSRPDHANVDSPFQKPAVTYCLHRLPVAFGAPGRARSCRASGAAGTRRRFAGADLRMPVRAQARMPG